MLGIVLGTVLKIKIKSTHTLKRVLDLCYLKNFTI